jgi:hypothetical protein
MGCDIHLYVERRTDSGWEHVPDHSDDWRDTANWYSTRNYNLFAILADVRNGHGFAGIKTGDGFIPIDYPRGLPADVSTKVDAECVEWGIDGHSHSHLTIAEILAFDWDQSTTLATPVGGDVRRPYYRCASDDWWGTVMRAARLSKGSLDDVRFVFWFDN